MKGNAESSAECKPVELNYHSMPAMGLIEACTWMQLGGRPWARHLSELERCLSLIIYIYMLIGSDCQVFNLHNYS